MLTYLITTFLVSALAALVWAEWPWKTIHDEDRADRCGRCAVVLNRPGLCPRCGYGRRIRIGHGPALTLIYEASIQP